MDLKIFTGEADQAFVKSVCDHIKVARRGPVKVAFEPEPLGEIEIKKFSDGEPWLQLKDNVRDTDVFLIQTFGPPSPEVSFFRLQMMIDAAKRASAKRITAVIPYFGFARQDRKDRSRVPITAKLAVDIIQAVGPDRVLSMDFHTNQMEGYFSNDYPLDHLYARWSVLPILRAEGRDYKVVAPDAGAIRRCKGYNRRLNQHPLLYADKERAEHNKSEVVEIVGDIEPGQTALLVDDIIDTGGTLVKVARGLKQLKGAKEIFAVGVHGVLSSDAIKRLADSDIDRIYITDSISRGPDWYSDLDKLGDGKFRVVSVAPQFGEAIHRLHTGQSLSPLFE